MCVRDRNRSEKNGDHCRLVAQAKSLVITMTIFDTLPDVNPVDAQMPKHHIRGAPSPKPVQKRNTR